MLILVLRRFAVVSAVACATAFIFSSLHWLLLGDASLMHYVVFLAERGLVPYRDIIDINLPGTYASEWVVMHLFGGGSLAWRLFDVFLGVAATAAMSVIAWPYDKLAGLFAGSLFFLIHGRDGMNELGQRDLLMTVVLLWSTALVLCALRRRMQFLIPLAGVLAGFAVTVKPTAALFWIATLGYAAFLQAGEPRRRLRLWLSGLASFLVVPAMALGFLIHIHALRPFWWIATRLIPFHNSLLRVPNSYFLLHPLPSTLIPLSLLGLIAVILRKREDLDILSGTEALIAINVVCGLLSFYMQRKALPYHRYPADAFLILLLCLIFFRALQSKGARKSLQVFGAAGLLLASLILAPQSLLRTFRLTSSPNDFSHLLQKDLTHLGGPSLNGKVQCVDFTAGCVTTLYRMKLVQSTGFLYDCYAFQPNSNTIVAEYRKTFWSALIKHQPQVIVVSNQDCGHANSFDKLDRWPQLNGFISGNYVLYKEVTPPDKIKWASNIELPYSYRIYVRQGSASGTG